VRFLLDVNVLIALLDPLHVHHAITHDWFAAEGRDAFATCPLTQNAVLRIFGHPRYPRSPGTPWAVTPQLKSLTALAGHQFWPDDVSLLDRRLVATERLTSSARLTDVYLLALAHSRGAKLATLDRRLQSDAVVDGAQALNVIG
jgi:hypothetical protein